MAKRYAIASDDVCGRLNKLRSQHYPELEGVTVTALFVFSDENEHVLTEKGYPAIATMKITSARDRAAGLADAIVTVDRYSYSGLTREQSNALLDHELHHLQRVIDDNGQPKADTVGRPKLKIRPHDRHFGWFDEIARRHGHHSIEVMQASQLAMSTGQLYFNFSAEAAA
jgi:hypothetical protein